MTLPASSWCAAIAALVFSASAAAETPPSPSAQASREMGEVHFTHGDYQAALALFQRAWEKGHAPQDLERIGKCRAKLHDNADAKDALFTFLQLEPESPLAAEAFALISEIEKSEAAAGPAGGLRGLGLSRKLALGTAGAAVVLVGVATIFGLQARATNREIGSQPHTRDQLEPLRDRVWKQAGRANSFFIAGGGALLSGGVLWVVNF